MLAGKEIDDDAECEPHIGEGKPREDQGEHVVLIMIVSQWHILVRQIRLTRAWRWKKNMRMIP